MKLYKKKIISVLLTLSMLTGFSGCGKNSVYNDISKDASVSSFLTLVGEETFIDDYVNNIPLADYKYKKLEELMDKEKYHMTSTYFKDIYNLQLEGIIWGCLREDLKERAFVNLDNDTCTVSYVEDGKRLVNEQYTITGKYFKELNKLFKSLKKDDITSKNVQEYYDAIKFMILLQAKIEEDKIYIDLDSESYDIAVKNKLIK